MEGYHHVFNHTKLEVVSSGDSIWKINRHNFPYVMDNMGWSYEDNIGGYINGKDPEGLTKNFVAVDLYNNEYDRKTLIPYLHITSPIIVVPPSSPENEQQYVDQDDCIVQETYTTLEIECDSEESISELSEEEPEVELDEESAVELEYKDMNKGIMQITI